MSALVIDALQAVGSASRLTVKVELTDARGDAIIGYVTGTDGTIVSGTVFHTDADGQLVIDLVPTADITPGNSCYTVTVGSKSFLIQKSGATQNLFEAVIVNPGDLDPVTSGVLLAVNNLSDVLDAETSRGNLGLGNSATLDVGNLPGTVAAGDDPRFDTIVTAHADLTGLTAADVHPGTSITNVPSGFVTSTHVQGAITELTSAVEANALTAATDLQTHIDNPLDVHDASAISSVPSGFVTADDVQEAIEQLVVGVGTAADGVTAGLAAHLADTTDAHLATAIGVTPAGSISSTTVQAALEELAGEAAGTGSGLLAHVNAVTDAHDASAISVVPTGGLVADDVQEALAELDTETAAVAADLAAHLADTTNAHAGTAIGFTPTGDLAATDVQAAIVEVDTELHAHEGDSSGAHAATAISFIPFGTVAATDVQAAIEEVFAEASGGGGGGTSDHDALFNRDAASQHPATSVDYDAAGTLSGGTVQAGLYELDGDIQAHITDTTDAHDATAVSFAPTGSFSSTDAQGAIVEAYTDATTYSDAALAGHTGDTVDAHDATAVSVVPFSSIAATDVQAALEEVFAAATVGLDEADEIAFTPTGDIVATNVQAAIVEVDGELHAHEADTTNAHAATAIGFTPTGDIVATTVQAAVAEVDAELHAHEADATAAHAASAVSVTPTGDLGSTDVQGALVELQGDIDASEAALAAHLADTVDAHDGSAISFVPTGTIAATDVQTAIAEVATDAAADLAAHLADTSDAHDASAISVVPTGDLSSTTVQAALVELQTDIDTDEAALAAHLADTTDAHDASAISFAATGDIVATDVQAAILEVDTELHAHETDATDAHDATAISSTTFGTITATNVQQALQDVYTAATAGLDEADEISFAPAGDIVATNVQAAIEEVDAELHAHEADTVDAHDASAISFSPASGIAATDAQAAIIEAKTDAQAYADAAVLVHTSDTTDAHDASAISITTGGTTLAASDVQGALAELDDDIQDHIADTTNAHLASSLGFSPTGTLSSTTVQAAIAETSGDVTALTTSVSTVSSDLAAHLADTVDAHDATAISFTPAGTISATTVQAAIEEVAAEAGGGGSIAATGVTVTPTGNLGSTDVQAALVELQGDIDSIVPGGGGVAVDATYAAVTTDVLRTRVTGDTTGRRFELEANGRHRWGVGGTTNADTNLNWSATAMTLETDRSTASAITGLTLYTKNNSTGNIIGLNSFATNNAGGTTAYLAGITSTAATVSTGTLTTAYGLDITSPNIGAGGIVSTNTGIRIQTQKPTGVTASFGVYQEGVDDTNFFAASTRFGNTATLPRLRIDIDGKLNWAAVASAVDTNLYRSAINTLKTDSNFFVVGTSTFTGAIGVTGINASGVYAGTYAATTTDALTLKVTGDTQPRFVIDADGRHEWGLGGVSAIDTNLYRSAINTLKTDGNLIVGGTTTFTGTTSGVYPLNTTDALNFRVTGDTQPRYVVDADGTHEWGSGSAVTNTTLTWSATAMLLAATKTSTSMVFGLSNTATNTGTGGVTGISTVASTGGAGVVSLIGNRVRLDQTAGSTTTGTAIQIDTPVATGGISSNRGIYIQNQKPSGVSAGYSIFAEGATDIAWLAGDSRFGGTSVGTPFVSIDTAGKMNFGTGSAATDTTFYRSAINTLKTDGNFVIVGTTTLTGALTSTSSIATTSTISSTSATVSRLAMATDATAASNVLVEVGSQTANPNYTSGATANYGLIVRPQQGGTASGILTGALIRPIIIASGASTTQLHAIEAGFSNAALGTIANARTVFIATPSTSAGTITTLTGLYINTQAGSGVTTAYAIQQVGASDRVSFAGPMGFFSATPAAQYGTTGTSVGFSAGAGTPATSTSTYTGNTGSIAAYTVGDIVRALKLYGLLA